jgi:aspartate/methionine/tyrosine aminotransferase
MPLVSSRVRAADAAFAGVRDFYFASRYAERRFEPNVCDFTFGNPHEMPLEGIVSALRDKITPHDKNWFAYKTSERRSRQALDRSAAPAARRDRLMATLVPAGYGVLKPKGTFYLWSRWPEGNPDEFWNRLANHDVFVLPGSIMSSPDYFRISLTASDQMVDAAPPKLAELAATRR